MICKPCYTSSGLVSGILVVQSFILGKKDEPLVISVEQYRSMSNPVGAKSTSLDIRDSGGRFMGIFPRVPSNNLDIAFTTVPVKLAGQTNAIPMTIKYRQQVVKCDDQGNLEHGGVYRDVEKEVHIADSDNETGRGEAAAPNADSNNGTGGPPPAKRIWLSTSTCAIKPETKPIKNGEIMQGFSFHFHQNGIPWIV